MKEHLGNPEGNIAPVLSHHDVFKKLQKGKKPNSVVPGDLPRKITKQFSFELTIPVTTIFNQISLNKKIS